MAAPKVSVARPPRPSSAASSGSSSSTRSSRCSSMPPECDEPIIAVEGLTIGYGETVVLAGLDFTVATGSVFAILGGSGSGKSTLLRHLIGLDEPMRGRITVHGAPP